MKFWKAYAKAEEPKVGKIDIYGDIVFGKWDKWTEDDVAASEFKDDLESLGDVDTISVSINSYGGDVFAGQAIHSMLRAHPAQVEVYVDGIAASIASVIAMAGDVVRMPVNAMLMVHNPWTFAIGNADYMRKMADDLDKIRESLVAAYMHKVGGKITEDELTALLDAETFLTAEESVSFGFADVVTEPVQIAAYASEILPRFKSVPAAIEAALSKGVEDAETAEERERLSREALESIEHTRAMLDSLSFGRED